MQTVFIVFENSDMTEGRGPMIINSVWTNQIIANQYIDTQPGVMGRKAKWSEEKYGDWKVEEVKVFDSLLEYHQFETDKIKKQALAKLSSIEKKALGL